MKGLILNSLKMKNLIMNMTQNIRI